MAEQVKQNEESKKLAREKNRDVIIEQMQRVTDRRKTDVRFAKSIPDIFGSQGYPPIYEPSSEQQRDVLLRGYQRQKEALLTQVI